MKTVRWQRVERLSEAVQALRDATGPAKIIAGGQSLLPMLKARLVEISTLIDISSVDDACDIIEEDGYLLIGALVRQRELELASLVAARQPMLAEAARWIGDDQVRARGTLGGSLAHSDPLAELPLVMVALGAEYVAFDGRDSRTIRADEFHVAPFATSLEDHELVLSARVPVLGPGWGWGFRESGHADDDFALVTTAALVRLADGEIIESRLAIGGVAERPVRIGAIEASILGARVEDLPSRIGPILELDPPDNQLTAHYRRYLARSLSIQSLSDACARARRSEAIN